jgi:16S rRNA (adenine1518-N6/adenine1519-N6)-dimethyltransferase
MGTGMGVLTKYLLDKTRQPVEIDTESVTYLDEIMQGEDRIISKDFLRYDINETFGGKQFAIIGIFL